MALTKKQKNMAEYIMQTRETAPAEIADKYPEYYSPWTAGEAVVAGARRAYGGVLYEAVQAHTTQADWTPDATPALWRRVYTEEYPDWVQPTGAHDSYNAGDKVKYNGAKWVSTVDNNVWQPGVYGWSEE